ncbi:hypothetical protein BaRGS_00034192 [Batillaria attramentaria]|uniref:Uncharacterized protein n=1 Tax=Batillaria attramentaria TaxID=370345 RepID=A0ABD0JHS0_9CAEN
MAVVLCVSSAALLTMMLMVQIPRVTCLDVTANVDVMEKTNTDPTLDGFVSDEDVPSVLQSAVCETSSVPVIFHTFLSLTTDDITRCFDARSHLPVSAAAGEISYSHVNKTFANDPACRLTLTAPEEQVVFFKMTSCRGYIQTPGWSDGKVYAANMDSCVTVDAPPLHFIMTSFLVIDLETGWFLGSGDVITLIKGENCVGEEAWRSTVGYIGLPEERLIQMNVMSIRFESDSQVEETGFRFFFSFHSQSALPQRLPDGKWNCSVPHWCDFKQHFLCTVKPECAGDEDAVFCLSAEDTCGHGAVLSGQKCFTYIVGSDVLPKVELNRTSWFAAREECAKRGMRLPNLETMMEQFLLSRILNVVNFEYFYIGLDMAREPMYHRSWQLSSGLIAYHIKVRDPKIEVKPPVCAAFIYTLRGKVAPVNCMEENTVDFLCELVDTKPLFESDRERVHLQIPTANASGLDLTLCPANHSTHTFLACDVHSACWWNPRDHCTAPMTPLPPSFLCANQHVHVPYTLMCDFRDDCGDESDENFCVFPTCLSSSRHPCDNGQCILQKKYCDGAHDCLDSSDERNCGEHVVVCDGPYCQKVIPPPAVIELDGLMEEVNVTQLAICPFLQTLNLSHVGVQRVHSEGFQPLAQLKVRIDQKDERKGFYLVCGVTSEHPTRLMLPTTHQVPKFHTTVRPDNFIVGKGFLNVQNSRPDVDKTRPGVHAVDSAWYTSYLEDQTDPNKINDVTDFGAEKVPIFAKKSDGELLELVSVEFFYCSQVLGLHRQNWHLANDPITFELDTAGHVQM